MITENKTTMTRQGYSDRMKMNPMLISAWLQSHGSCDMSKKGNESNESREMMICMSPFG